MSRPTGSLSGLARTNKTIRIDPILRALAEYGNYNFSNAVEDTILETYGSEVNRDLLYVVLINDVLGIGADIFELESKLSDVAIESHGYTLDQIAEGIDGIEDIAPRFKDWNWAAEGFSDAYKEHWNEADVFNGPYRNFYCVETDTFGTYIATKEAWDKDLI